MCHSSSWVSGMDQDRRSKARFRLELSVRYRSTGRGKAIAGVGKTIDISSRGVLIKCSGVIPKGTRLILVVDWPCRLNGATELQLVAAGKVVRTHSGRMALAVAGYEFRTAGRRADIAVSPTGTFPAPAPEQRAKNRGDSAPTMVGPGKRSRRQGFSKDSARRADGFSSADESIAIGRDVGE